MILKKTSITGLPKGTKIFTLFSLAWALVIALGPLVWLILSSLKKDPLLRPGFMLPDSLYFGGYVSAFVDLHILRYFANSLIISGISVIISVTMISMSAYIVARFEFKFKSLINTMLYATMFVPATALMYPVYNLVNKMGIYNTRTGLIFIYACSGIALSFFIIKNYYTNVPKELEEAARIDGCGYFSTWWHIIFPLARPGIMTAGVLAFLNNWNEYYWASLIITTAAEKQPVPVLLSTFTTTFRTNYNGLFSAIVVIILPPVILYLIFNKFFIEALSGGAVKG